jgi:hypothetical protein
MRLVPAVVAVVAVLATSARAQPGPDTPPPGAPAPAPSGPPAGPSTYGPPPAPSPYGPGGYPAAPGAPPGVPPPYAYQPPPPTPEEQDLLRQGYISPLQTVAGGLISIWLGFGIGQVAEGRWHESGWIFTLGESASIVGIIGGAISLANCDGNHSCSGYDSGGALIIVGAIAFGGFRIWEIVDAFGGPSGHNERVHELRRRYGYRDDYARITPYLARPHGSNGGMTAGLTLRF